MVKVVRKDKESFENLLRRFNKRIQDEKILVEAKKRQFKERTLSKKEERELAIRKRIRREQKLREILRGG